MHRYVADEGSGVAKSEIEHVTLAGRTVAIGKGITAEDRELIKKAITQTRPTEKACYSNALNMWAYSKRFEYTEGFAVIADLDVGGIEHAWCMLDGDTLVDPTNAFDHYFGASITDPEILRRYLGADLCAGGIIGNHKNQYEFLRARGYVYNQ